MKAPKSRGAGRPAFREGTARTAVFSLKLAADERAEIEATAARAGLPLTQWAREAMLSVARAAKS